MSKQLFNTTEAANYLQTSVNYLKYLRTKQAKAESRVSPTYITTENFGCVAGRFRVHYTQKSLDAWLKLYRKYPKSAISA